MPDPWRSPPIGGRRTETVRRSSDGDARKAVDRPVVLPDVDGGIGDRRVEPVEQPGLVQGFRTKLAGCPSREME